MQPIASVEVLSFISSCPSEFATITAFLGPVVLQTADLLLDWSKFLQDETFADGY